MTTETQHIRNNKDDYKVYAQDTTSRKGRTLAEQGDLNLITNGD